MKNRDLFNKKCIYDILCAMQKNRGFCVIEDITQLPWYCITQSTSDVENCEECI